MLKVENISDPFTHGITPTTEPVTEPPVTTEETRPPMATAPNFEEMTEPTFPEVTEPVQWESDTTYTVKLAAATPIYSRPDSRSAFVDYVGKAGTYTIVEEALDDNGNLWGKLKSGLGWIPLY